MGNKNTAQSGLPRPQEYHQEHMLETFIIRDSKVCHREIRGYRSWVLTDR
jgi:hypothetical protein